MSVMAWFLGVGYLGVRNHSQCLPQGWNLPQVKAQVKHVQNRLGELVCVCKMNVFATIPPKA